MLRGIDTEIRDWKLRDMTLKLLLNSFYRNLSRKFLICSDPENGAKEIQSVHDQEIVKQRTICKPIRVKGRLRNNALNILGLFEKKIVGGDNKREEVIQDPSPRHTLHSCNGHLLRFSE